MVIPSLVVIMIVITIGFIGTQAVPQNIDGQLSPIIPGVGRSNDTATGSSSNETATGSAAAYTGESIRIFVVGNIFLPENWDEIDSYASDGWEVKSFLRQDDPARYIIIMQNVSST